jgi:hypothetical protein
MNHEEKVLVLLESMEIAATCMDCGRISLEIWMAKGACPHCENRHLENEYSLSNLVASDSIGSSCPLSRVEHPEVTMIIGNTSKFTFAFEAQHG